MGHWQAPADVSHLCLSSKSREEIVEAEEGTFYQVPLQENVHFGPGFKVNEYPIRIFLVSLSFIAINWPNFDLLIISTA